MAVMTVEVSEWERMEQQITTLRAQLSIEEGVVDDYCEQIDELKAQLKKHGGHTAMCPASTCGRAVGMKNCDPELCGWAAIEHEIHRMV